MQFHYTFHALDAIAERKIEKIWVKEALQFPDITYFEEGKYYAVKKLNGLSIEVVYVKEKYIKIITVYWV